MSESEKTLPDSKTPLPSVSERRGQRLAPLQTNFSRPTSRLVHVVSPRPQRPRPSEYDNNGTGERIPLQPGHVKRQSSRSSLRHLFSREKSTRRSTDSRLSGIEEAQPPVKPAQNGANEPLSPSICASPRTVTSTPTLPTSPTDPRQSRLPSKHRSRPSENQPSTSDVAWKPPPLFQAYPQAIKHISLQAPAISADSIVRLHAAYRAREHNLQGEPQHGRRPSNGGPADDLTTRKKKIEKERRKYARALSDSIEKSEWSEKTYLLATSGYILQYAGGGRHDRLPEKMLLLGPKSVAFASDAIPGKHWVLQVSQTSEEDSTNHLETSRPLISRLGFHRSHARRIARNFLLVFNSPEELSSWLLAVRAQIEDRGGKKYVSERVFDDGMEHQLRSTPSVRQLVKKDPNRFSTVYLQSQQPTGSDEKELSVGDQSTRNSYISLHRRSMVIHPAPGSRSESVSTIQTEVVSTSTVDDSSRFYSALGSPPLPDGSVVSDTTSMNGPNSPTVSSPKKRRSLYLPQVSGAEIAQIPRAQSTVPDAHARSVSPPAPNFSVPSFSRRFARPDVPQIPCFAPAVGDQTDDASTDALSVFSSPPQSPGREVLNGTPKGFSREQHRVISRQELLKKQIRVSSSDDSLGEARQDRDRSRLRFSRMPSGSDIRSTCVTPDTPQPVEFMSPGSLTAQESTRLPSDAEKKQNQRIRSSVLCSQDLTPVSAAAIVSKRKSLSGLSIGPPVAPPPNCPLPKIPSSFVKSSPPSAPPQQSPPSPPTEDWRKSLAASPPRSTHSHLPQTARSLPSRHSRLAQGI